MRSFCLLAIVSVCALAGCPGPSAQDVCNKLANYERRCMMVSDCEINVGLTRCQMETANVRQEYLNAINNCNLDSLACGDAGTAATQMCVLNALNASISSGGYQNFLSAACTACPMLGTFNPMMMPTTQQCIQSGSMPVSIGDGGGTALGSFLEIFALYNDGVLNPITTCLQQIHSSGTAACQSAQMCLQNSPLLMMLQTDAGTCPTMSDASVD